MRYLIRSATVIISSPCRFANRDSCGTRAIVPSSFITSQMTPAGCRPAMRAISTDASVWPVRTRTPPSRARSGETCPGRTESDGLVAGWTAAGTVAARSAAEMPVVTSCLASIGTQNAVLNGVVFDTTARGISSSSSRAPVIERQIWPRPWRAMKLIVSGVTFSAAIVRSPSFSRSASSTMMIILPSRTESTASSMRANGECLAGAISRAGLPFTFCPLPFILSVCHFPGARARERQSGELRGADDVLAHHIAFEVDPMPQLRAAEVRVLHRERHELDVESIDAEAGDCQADAVDGDRPFVHEEWRKVRRKADRHPVELGGRAQLLDVADRIDVPLHEVAPDAAVVAHRALEV